MVRNIIVIVGILFVSAYPASGFPDMKGNHLDAMQLRDNCLQAEGTSGDLVCLLYIAGVLDGIATANFSSQSMSAPYAPICAPEKKPLRYYADIVKSYMQTNKEDLNVSASIFIWLAMKGSFPCDDGAGIPK